MEGPLAPPDALARFTAAPEVLFVPWPTRQIRAFETVCGAQEDVVRVKNCIAQSRASIYRPLGGWRRFGMRNSGFLLARS